MLTKILAIFGVAGLMVLSYALGAANTEPSDEQVSAAVQEGKERARGDVEQIRKQAFSEGRKKGREAGFGRGFVEGQDFALGRQTFSPHSSYVVDVRESRLRGPHIVAWARMKNDFFYRCLPQEPCEVQPAYQGE